MNDFTGFPNGITVQGSPIMASLNGIPSLGKVFYVCSTSTHSDNAIGVNNSSTNGLHPTTPFATVVYALTQCTANNGDVVYVMPGHTETIAAAGGWTIPAGVAVIGLGRGSIRPLISLSATASTVLMSAVSGLVENIVFQSTVAELVTVFNITASYNTVRGCMFRNHATATNTCLSFATIGAAASYCTVEWNYGYQALANIPAGNASWVSITGHASTSHGHTIRNNDFRIALKGTAATAGLIQVITTATQGISITENYLLDIGAGTSTVPIALVASSTGWVSRNIVASAKTAIAGSIAMAGAYGSENYASHTVNKQGFLDPVVDT